MVTLDMSVVMEDPAGELMRRDQYGPPPPPSVYHHSFITRRRCGDHRTEQTEAFLLKGIVFSLVDTVDQSDGSARGRG